MLPDDGADFLLRSVAPAGLNVAKRPFRGQVALTNDAAEGVHDALQAVLFNQINTDISLRAGDHRLVAVRVAKIEHHIAGVIKVHAEKAAIPEKDQQVVAAVQAFPAFVMAGIIRVPCPIAESTLIDAPDIFAQAEDHIMFPKRHRKAECLSMRCGSHIGQATLPHGHRDNYCVGRDRGTKVISANHKKALRFIDHGVENETYFALATFDAEEKFPAGGKQFPCFVAFVFFSMHRQ